MKPGSLRSRFALLCAGLVASALLLFAVLSAWLFHYEQLDAFSEDHSRVPSARDRREAFEGVLTLVSCDAVLLPVTVALAAGVAWACGRHLLEHLSSLADSADGITARNLDQRIPDRASADEVVRLTRAFNALLGRLEQSLLNIKRFTADASHELRIPLTLMKCEVEALLLRREEGGLEESCERLLLEIHRLNGICDSLLFLTRADVGAVQITPERIDLSSLCTEIVEDLEALAAPAGIHVESELPPDLCIRGDGLWLRRMLLNLLDNALKYNRPGGWIRLAITRDDGYVRVNLENSGPEIPVVHHAAIFERFYRADASRNRETGGAGLGLSICREIARLHDGEIRLKSSTEEMTCFEATLPILSESQAGADSRRSRCPIGL